MKSSIMTNLPVTFAYTRRESRHCSSTTTLSRSICSKLVIVTAIYALLFCSTSEYNVVAYSEKRVMKSHDNINSSGETFQEQSTNTHLQPSLIQNKNKESLVQQGKYTIHRNNPTKVFPDLSKDNERRRIQRRGDTGSSNSIGYDAYGVPPTSNTETTNNNDADKGGTGWFGKKQRTDNTENSATSTGGNSAYGSYYGSSSSGNNGASSSAYGTYGSNAGTSAGTSNTYGSYGASPSSSSSAYGASSPRSSSSYYGGSSYSSTWGAGSASSTSSSSSHQWGSSSSLRGGKGFQPVKIDLFKAIFFLLLICTTGMLLTAHSMEHHPEGTFANCCRVSLHTVNCVYLIIFNLYHCRLGELPGIICGGSELEEDEYTEEELERMTLRPGIEGALDREHRKALRKVGVEMNMIKPKNGGAGKGKAKVENGASISR
jgi:hypothetical protein